jgi:hypothetical protein
MVAPTPSKGYSAKVRLQLEAGGKCWRLAQIAGDRLIFSEPVILPGSTGEAVAFIDDSEHRWTATWAESNVPRQLIPAELREISR